MLVGVGARAVVREPFLEGGLSFHGQTHLGAPALSRGRTASPQQADSAAAGGRAEELSPERSWLSMQCVSSAEQASR